MKNLIIICLGVMLYSNASRSEEGYFEDRRRGWFWYEKIPDKPNKTDKPVERPSYGGGSNQSLSAKEIIKKQREEWDDAVAEAIVYPTKKNVVKYLAVTQKINEQAMNFSSAFKRAVWVNPEYDYTLKDHPVTTQAIAAKNQQDLIRNDSKLRKLADKVGLIFYFRSDCPHCHRFAPVFKKFTDQYGFTVVPVSLDGGGIDNYFPYPKKDYALGRKLKISAVPAVYLLNPDSNVVAPVSFGYSDWTSLKQKVLASADQMEQERGVR